MPPSNRRWSTCTSWPKWIAASSRRIRVRPFPTRMPSAGFSDDHHPLDASGGRRPRGHPRLRLPRLCTLRSAPRRTALPLRRPACRPPRSRDALFPSFNAQNCGRSSSDPTASSIGSRRAPLRYSRSSTGPACSPRRLRARSNIRMQQPGRNRLLSQAGTPGRVALTLPDLAAPCSWCGALG